MFVCPNLYLHYVLNFCRIFLFVVKKRLLAIKHSHSINYINTLILLPSRLFGAELLEIISSSDDKIDCNKLSELKKNGPSQIVNFILRVEPNHETVIIHKNKSKAFLTKVYTYTAKIPTG